MEDWKVYRHISPSGKVYIGITHMTLKRRFNNGNGYADCTLFRNAINKYGWNNIKHELLFDNLNKVSAEQIEIDLIYYYKSLNMSYNISNGGESVMFGRNLSIEHKKKIGESQGYGENNIHSKKVNMYSLDGVFIKSFASMTVASNETGCSRKHISDCCNGRIKSTGGYIWKIHESNNNIDPLIKNIKKKKIIQYDKCMNKIAIWNSVSEAAESLGLHRGNIVKCCKFDKHYKTTGGFIFRYLDD